MANVSTLFWDVGGVVLSNGWDRSARRKATEKFKLDWEDFEDRHELVVSAFEKGQLVLEEYLDRIIFYRSRSFTKEEFKEFMFGQSTSNPETLDLLARLASAKKCLLATINNESLEMNLFRINQFGLQNYFSAFFSSCFLGVRKPHAVIYKQALQITQSAPENSVFIDDRPLNLECAQRLGMRTVAFQSSAQLENELLRLGIQI